VPNFLNSQSQAGRAAIIRQAYGKAIATAMHASRVGRLGGVAE